MIIFMKRGKIFKGRYQNFFQDFLFLHTSLCLNRYEIRDSRVLTMSLEFTSPFRRTSLFLCEMYCLFKILRFS